MVAPQSENQVRFVGATDLFARIKACTFFKYHISARSGSFSSRKASAESGMAVRGGSGRRCSGLMTDDVILFFSASTLLRRQTTTWFGLRMS